MDDAQESGGCLLVIAALILLFIGFSEVSDLHKQVKALEARIEKLEPAK